MRSVNLGFVFDYDILAGICLTINIIAIFDECLTHPSGFDVSGDHAFVFGIIVFDRVLFKQGARLSH